LGKTGQKKTETWAQSHESVAAAGGFTGTTGPRATMAANRIGAIIA
jgi:hypothetical protein